MDVLVLNHAYMPINRVSWQTAFGWLFTGRVEVVEEYEDREIRSASQTWKMPSIIRFMRKVVSKFMKGPRFNRKNVYLRDKGKCQYCRVKVTLSEFTYDHVLPRSRGGKTTWENIVVSCLPCNQKKGDRTPEQAGVKLRSRPVRPKSLQGMSVAGKWSQGMPESWKDWLRGAHYWTDTLDS